MGKPAARLGDMTAHGGAIVMGFPMVLIGGMPAARLGDMHVCPMLTPGVPPIPHVGGPIMLGSPMVLIGGQPAARMGDMVMCVGPPATILMGCPTVLIGEGGSGSAKGGGAGSSGAADAHASAATALTDNNETWTKVEHWVEFEFVDKAGNPVSGIPYKFTDPGGKESDGVLRLDGKIRRDEMKKGQCNVLLYYVSNAKWSKENAKVGENVKMTADVEGYESGAKALFQVYRRDIKCADVVVASIEATTQGKKVEAEWEYKYSEEPDKKSKGEAEQKGYSHPEYFFEVIVGRSKARSGVLTYQDWIEIELKDHTNKPIADEEYVLALSTGEVRKGKLDSSGRKREEKVLPGSTYLRFPRFSKVAKRS